MIKINLLPIKKIKQKLRRRREFFVLIGSFLFLLLLLGLGAQLLNGQLRQLEETSAKLAEQQRSYQALQRQINQLKEDREILTSKINTIEQLRADSQLPVRIMDETSKLTPSQRLWLNSLRISDHTLSLTGIGLDNPTIAQYMRNLEGSDYFIAADLASSAQTEVDGRKLKSFTLSVTITPPATSEVEESAEEGDHGR